MFEHLETRRLLSASFASDGTLSVGGTAGDDVITFSRGNRRLIVSVNGEETSYRYSQVTRIIVSGGDGDDLIVVGPREVDATIAGGRGDDTLSGGAGDDEIDGGRGNDSLSGGGGDDLLNGGRGDGADTLFGEAGDDTVHGGDGTDTVVNSGDADEGEAEVVDSSWFHATRHKLTADEVTLANQFYVTSNGTTHVELELKFDFDSSRYDAVVTGVTTAAGNVVRVDLSSPRTKGPKDATPTTKMLRFALPPLAAGTYTVQLAQPEFATSGFNVFETFPITVSNLIP
jgi:hypothetical protein